MQRNLRLRAVVNDAMRRSMIGQEFVEIETPALIASTPEGARDFVVPSRLQPGSFYALPQSPQLFKQLLMVGGFDRYFQIARCLRDEDPRADRQFEFMQYDMEMSFADADDVMAVVTEAVQAAVEAARGERAPVFRRMTWQESMDRFGVDKPDTRFGLELVDVSECFEATEFRAFQAEAVNGFRVPGEGAMGPTLGSSFLMASNAGSILDSEPPLSLAISTMNAVPRLEARPVMPTRPLYSGFHKSSHDVGGVLIFFGLYAMPINCTVITGA